MFNYSLQKTEKVYFRSQILELPSIGEYWNILGVPVLPENVIFTFFRTCWCYSGGFNTGMQKWSSIVQYSHTSIWDLKFTFSQKTFATNWVKIKFSKYIYGQNKFFIFFFSVFYCFDLYDVILASQANCWCLFYFSFTQSMGLEQPHPFARYVAKTAWLEKCKLCLLIFFLCCCCCYFTEYFKSSHWISLSTSKYLENSTSQDMRKYPC